MLNYQRVTIDENPHIFPLQNMTLARLPRRGVLPFQCVGILVAFLAKSRPCPRRHGGAKPWENHGKIHGKTMGKSIKIHKNPSFYWRFEHDVNGKKS